MIAAMGEVFYPPLVLKRHRPEMFVGVKRG